MAGVVSIVPVLIGSYVTVNISLFFKLDALQDSAIAFIPFLAVHYMVYQTIPTYKLLISGPVETELAIASKEIEDVTNEIGNPLLVQRKKYLQNKMEKLLYRQDQLRMARNWLREGDLKVKAVQDDYSGFLQRLENTRQEYMQNKSSSDHGISFLSHAGMICVEKAAFPSQWFIDNKTDLKTKDEIASFISYYETAKLNVVSLGRRLPQIDFEFHHLLRRNCAMIEINGDKISQACASFDKKHLDDYNPAYIKFQVDDYKVAIAFKYLIRYPSTNLVKECEECLKGLDSSAYSFKVKVSERIHDYNMLQREDPDCYIVNEFSYLGGRFGLSALRDMLRSIEELEIHLASTREMIEKSKESLRLIAHDSSHRMT